MTPQKQSHQRMRWIILIVGLLSSWGFLYATTVTATTDRPQGSLPGHSPSLNINIDDTGVVVGDVISHTFALEVVDLDGDQDLDLVSGDESGRIIAWQNHGLPFQSAWTSHVIGRLESIPVVGLVSGDLDRDGWIDLAAAHEEGPTIWHNDGTPFDGSWFRKNLDYAAVGSIAIADIDGDNRPDVIAGMGLPWWDTPSEYNHLFVWHGPKIPFGEAWPMTDVGPTTYTVLSLDVGDLDKDGDKDIVIGTERAPTVGDKDNPVPREMWPDVYQVRAFRNDGHKEWTAFDIGRDPKYQTLDWVDYVGFWGCAVTHVSLNDLDQDGDLDILSTQQIECDYQVMGWQNNGSPFSGELWAPSAISKGYIFNWIEDSALWAEAADLDQDGDIDVVSGGRSELEPWQIIAWENSGVVFGEVVSDTAWIRHDLVSRGEDVWTVRTADFDQDGDQDLASAVHTKGPNQIRLWENKAGYYSIYLPAVLK